MVSRLGGVLLVSCCGATAGCGHASVARVMEGEEVAGRFIGEQAYEAYLRGAIEEEQGALDAAEQSFREAHEADRDGVAPLVRLGAIRCARAGRLTAQADEAFQAGIGIDPEFGPLYVERARCALRAGDATAAEADARRAMKLDPRDSEATIVLAAALEREARWADAFRILNGYTVWKPDAVDVWRAIERTAGRAGDRVRQTEAREHLGGIESRGALPLPSGVALAQIDVAIEGGDRDRARRLVLGAGLPIVTVALRAASMGRWEDALQEARLVLAADPTDVNGLAVVLGVPDTRLVRERLGQRLWSLVVGSRASWRLNEMMPLAALLIADALQRQVGVEASKTFLAHYGPIAPDPYDPLLRAGGER